MEEWSREKIRFLREQRAKEERKTHGYHILPSCTRMLPQNYIGLSSSESIRRNLNARSCNGGQRSREVLQRPYQSTKAAQATLKSDLSTLLKTQTLSLLNNSTLPSHLPPAILADIRYISLDPSIRDELVEAYISILPPPPNASVEEESEEIIKERKDRDRSRKL